MKRKPSVGSLLLFALLASAAVWLATRKAPWWWPAP
jgi:hypothetical protein